jgi:uncharacterized protein (DUF58 family)
MIEAAKALGERSLWRPTAALLRSLFGGAAMTLTALTIGRPDLLVLGAPLVLIAVWSLMTRPHDDPNPQTSLAHRSLREGEATTWHTSMTTVPGMEQVVVAVAVGRWLNAAPATGMRTHTVSAGTTGAVIRLDIGLQSRRWGRRELGSGLVAATSAWGAFRFGPHNGVPRTLWTLPLPATFDAKAPTPSPNGLVGLNRSRRAGDGSEFASIRAFQPGDRLRRIHWPLSLRAGELYVTSTWADQDSRVMLLVDAHNDLGESGGLGREASSLDVTVRAAAAMAEHYLHRGDRVGLRVFGAINVARLPAMAGRSHLRRVLDTLAVIEAGTDRHSNPTKVAGDLTAGTLVVVLSPLVSPDALTYAVTLARRGLSVIIIDTLPDRVDRQEDAGTQLAWRIRRLERERDIRRVQESGIPTVPWRGPGSLDQVLRDLGRRSSAARMARR